MNRIWTTILLACCVIIIPGLVGCSSPFHSDLDDAVRSTYSWRSLKTAALDAAVEPDVILPVLGAAVFSMGDLDHDVSEWATEHNPIYGSDETARDTSDTLRYIAIGSTAYSWYDIRPPHNASRDEQLAYQHNVLVDLSAIASSEGLTQVVKSSVGRERPDGSNDHSFPSGHAEGSAVLAGIARRNLRNSEHAGGADQVIDRALFALPYATAWARVEGEKHYPSDVLFGLALGNFFAHMANKLHMKPGREPSRLTFYGYPREDGNAVMLGFRLTY